MAIIAKVTVSRCDVVESDIIFSTLMTAAVGSSETLVQHYQTKRRYIPEVN